VKAEGLVNKITSELNADVYIWSFCQIRNDETQFCSKCSNASIHVERLLSHTVCTRGYHDILFNPTNSKNMILADDGGEVSLFNVGKTWFSTVQYGPLLNSTNPIPTINSLSHLCRQADNLWYKHHGIGRVISRHLEITHRRESASLPLIQMHLVMIMGELPRNIDLLDMKSGDRPMWWCTNPISGRDASDMPHRYNLEMLRIKSGSQTRAGTFIHGSPKIFQR